MSRARQTALVAQIVAALAFLGLPAAVRAGEHGAKPLCISGIYPHLAVYNNHDEAGIGALAVWAGKLWYLTYPSHKPRGSNDKLYELDESLRVRIRPESVGGTHACRMIHEESHQLIIGPYFIDAEGNVRAADVKNKLVGRMTAVARHLKDPANLVYFFDMEGRIYEVDVHTLDVRLLFEKPVPGWHGKGGYTGQGRFIIANNGDQRPPARTFAKSPYLAGGPPRGPEEAGILAEYDGARWRIVLRRQFLDVTGPGGIRGAPRPEAPVWTMGWDRRSVILMLLDHGTWHLFRLPKASRCFDGTHGWFTEWPRIREVVAGKFLMDVHGMFWDFPPTFAAGRTGRLRPLSQHLRNVPDFCAFGDRVVLGADDTSTMQNRLAGQPQSNLWFGTWRDLEMFGPPAGYGGVWRDDPVKAGRPSAPFLLAGFSRRVLHLAHEAACPVCFRLEIDPDGAGRWKSYRTITLPARSYTYHVFPPDLEAQWVRITAEDDTRASAFFHLASPRRARQGAAARGLFGGLARAGTREPWSGGLVRPAGHNRKLQFLARRVAPGGKVSDEVYFEVDENLHFHRIEDRARADAMRRLAGVRLDLEVDDASVILKRPGGGRLRLPRGDAAFDRPFATGWPRGIREAVSERYLANLHGTIYEVPREDGFKRLKPVCSHHRIITDFCTWRGLLVLAGCRTGAPVDGHVFGEEAPTGFGLWFGHIDDLWNLGKPTGKGGPWKGTDVRAGVPSDPYLMTGYDRKRLEMSHESPFAVDFEIEVDFINDDSWHTYRRAHVEPRAVFTHEFPDGFNAHWVRLRASRDTTATAILTYE